MWQIYKSAKGGIITLSHSMKKSMTLHRTSRTWQKSPCPAATVRISEVSIAISTLIEHSSQYNRAEGLNIYGITNIIIPAVGIYGKSMTPIRTADIADSPTRHSAQWDMPLRSLHRDIYPNRTYITIDNTHR